MYMFTVLFMFLPTQDPIEWFNINKDIIEIWKIF